MTKIELNIADDLASKAEAAGLLTQERLENMLRAQLKRSAGEQLQAMMGKAHAASGPEMPMDKINDVVKDARRDRRGREVISR